MPLPPSLSLFHNCTHTHTHTHAHPRFEKDKTVTILEGVPGLEIISSPMHDDALVSSSSKACLVLERLTRQKVKQQG